MKNEQLIFLLTFDVDSSMRGSHPPPCKKKKKTFPAAKTYLYYKRSTLTQKKKKPYASVRSVLSWTILVQFSSVATPLYSQAPAVRRYSHETGSSGFQLLAAGPHDKPQEKLWK